MSSPVERPVSVAAISALLAGNERSTSSNTSLKRARRTVSGSPSAR